ncbi:MAG: F0F1 ATP synthase subunit A [Acidobacteriota bacterium]
MAAGGEEQHSIFYKPFNAAFDKVVEVAGLQERFGETEVPEHVVMSLVVCAAVTVLAVAVSRGLKRDNPGTFQQVAEVFVGSLRNMLDDIIGEGGGRRFLPFIGTFAVFIFVSNLAGQFFFLQPPTQNTNVTFALAITAWIGYNLMGLKAHGLAYFKQFLGPVPWLIPLMLPIEIVSHFARCLSLGMRLFGNIFGEHVAVGVFFSLVPAFMPLPLMALGLLASGIQTFIFVILTTSYIAGAESSEH